MEAQTLPTRDVGFVARNAEMEALCWTRTQQIYVRDFAELLVSNYLAVRIM